MLPELQPDPDAGDLLVQGHEVNDVALLTELNLPWGYTATTAAGEGVRILDLPTARRPPELTEIDHDFWLIDGEQVVRMPMPTTRPSWAAN